MKEKLKRIKLVFFFFLAALEFELRASHLLGRHSTTWATLPALFSIGYFWDRILQTVCLGWLWTTIFLISASWVDRITCVSHLHPGREGLLNATWSWGYTLRPQMPTSRGPEGIDSMFLGVGKSCKKIINMTSECSTLLVRWTIWLGLGLWLKYLAGKTQFILGVMR
jgi:hypothetical protein